MVLSSATAETATLPVWATVLAVGAIGGGSLGWWRVVRLLVGNRSSPELTRESGWQATMAGATIVVVLALGLWIPL